MSDYDWRLLRIKANVLDDTDFVDGQSVPPDADLATVTRIDGDDANSVTLETVVEFLDVGGAIVTGASDAGSFNLGYIRLIERPPVPPAAPTVMVTDSEVIAGQGHRPVLIDDARVGDIFSVRLDTIVAPAGATQLRVYWKHMREQ